MNLPLVGTEQGFAGKRKYAKIRQVWAVLAVRSPERFGIQVKRIHRLVRTTDVGATQQIEALHVELIDNQELKLISGEMFKIHLAAIKDESLATGQLD